MQNSFLIKQEKYIDDTIRLSDLSIDRKELENAVVNVGNRHRIGEVIKKAMRGEEVVISFFGGSITAGSSSAAAPKEEYELNAQFPLRDNTYPHHVCRWFEEMFSCPVQNANVGIGATDTPYAVHRMGEDVLAKNPDLVIVEWCVNDGSEFLYKQGTYEAMVRRFLESGTALVMLSMDTTYNSSSQALHEPIARHYGVPHISYRNAFGFREDFYKFSNENVHPNSVGHPLAALILNHYFGKVCEELEDIEKSDALIPDETIHPDGKIYDGAAIYSLKDIYEGKYQGIRIKSLGSFSIDSDERRFGFKKYFGFTAEYSQDYSPMIIEIDSCKTLFLQIFRSNANKGSLFNVKINGEEKESKTFTCMHGTDNAQTEWSYHWATERVCYYPQREKVVLEITPNITEEYAEAKVKLYALLIS